jgi:broad specificity phosphatase PhoE
MPFYLIRHGQKEPGKFYNPVLRHQDPPISESGINEANQVALYFQSIKVHSIYVSCYKRTFETIEPLSKKLGIEPQIDSRLNELDNGLIDDMDEQEFEQRFPEVWKAYKARKSDFRFPKGETGQEARERVASFLEEKRKSHKSENIIIISHDGLIRVCMTYILGVPVYHRGDFKVNTCGITELEYQEDVQRWKLIRFNHTLQF